MGEGRIHAHSHELAKHELLFLQVQGITVDHPRTGPVTTSDITDCMFNVVAHLMDPSAQVLQRLSAQSLYASYPGGLTHTSAERDLLSRLSSARPGREPPHNPARGRRR